jgi:hypothetical protein
VAFNPRAILDRANLLDRLINLEKKHGALIEERLRGGGSARLPPSDDAD